MPVAQFILFMASLGIRSLDDPYSYSVITRNAAVMQHLDDMAEWKLLTPNNFVKGIPTNTSIPDDLKILMINHMAVHFAIIAYGQ